MKPKEWLLKHGHVKEITRGRISRENIARIEDAVRAGAVIEGYVVSTVQPKSSGIDKPALKVDKVSTASDRMPDVPDETRDEREMTAFSENSKGERVVVGMRTVCNTCHSSLTYCICQIPVVWISSSEEGRVQFKRKTSRG